jgi:hypothetical protein
MMAYKIMLVMIIFSAVNGGLNTLGWYSTKLPEQDAGISKVQVTELTQSVQRTSINPWTAFTVLSTVFQVLGSAMLSLLTILPFLLSMGMNLQMAMMIQTPIWLVMAWAVYQMWTGHSSMGQD